MNKELITMVDIVSKEKNLNRDSVFKALEHGIETSLRKDFPVGSILSVEIDRHTGEIFAARVYNIVEEVLDSNYEVGTFELDGSSFKVDPNAKQIFDAFEFTLTRQQFNIARQVALQELKKDVKQRQIDDLLAKSNKLLFGVVKVAKKESLLIDIGGLEVIIPRRNLLHKDSYKPEDKIYFVVDKIEPSNLNVIGSRTNTDFIVQLLKREIFEIEDNSIEVMNIVRQAGFKTKVAVRSNKPGLDAVKTVLGFRGAKIKSINGFLNGESVDVISYDEDPIKYLLSALSLFNVTRVSLDEEEHTIDICVADEDINAVKGKNNTNIDLITSLVGWKVNVFTEKEWDSQQNANFEEILNSFMSALDVDEEIAQLLAENSFNTIEEIAYVPSEEFADLELDDDTVAEIKSRAKQFLAKQEILALEEKNKELVSLGFSSEEIGELNKNEVFNKSDVADLGTFDLLDFLPEMGEEKAKNVIMKARDLV
jgi:transcription termination/antitermination protein NusA